MQPKIDPIARYSGFKDRLPVIGRFGVGAPGHRAPLSFLLISARFPWFSFQWSCDWRCIARGDRSTRDEFIILRFTEIVNSRLCHGCEKS
jgi:hypothetical protein